MSDTHDRFVRALNDHPLALVDDGCFDRANTFYDLLDEYDLLIEEDVDVYAGRDDPWYEAESRNDS